MGVAERASKTWWSGMVDDQVAANKRIDVGLSFEIWSFPDSNSSNSEIFSA